MASAPRSFRDVPDAVSVHRIPIRVRDDRDAPSVDRNGFLLTLDAYLRQAKNQRGRFGALLSARGHRNTNSDEIGTELAWRQVYQGVAPPCPDSRSKI